MNLQRTVARNNAAASGRENNSHTITRQDSKEASCSLSPQEASCSLLDGPVSGRAAQSIALTLPPPSFPPLAPSQPPCPNLPLLYWRPSPPAVSLQVCRGRRKTRGI
eukprot:scaffold34318_cov32-Tisochrysis_lutea.AAC.4